MSFGVEIILAKLNIRDIRISDKEEYIKMYENLFSGNATVTEYDEEVALLNFNNALSGFGSIRCLIFEYKTFILGYAFLSFSYSTSIAMKCLCLEDLYIKEQARGKGVGKYFIEWLLKEYKNRVGTINLEVTRNNLSARKFYEGLNFRNSRYMHMYLSLK